MGLYTVTYTITTTYHVPYEAGSGPEAEMWFMDDLHRGSLTEDTLYASNLHSESMEIGSFSVDSGVQLTLF